MKALNGFIILTPKEEEKEKNGIITTIKKKFSQEGTVVSVGEDVDGVKVGDKIVYKNIQPIEYTKDDVLYFIIDKYSVFINLGK